MKRGARTVVGLLGALAMLGGLPAATQATIWSGQGSDPADRPISEVDLAGFAVSQDDQTGRLAAFISFARPLPEAANDLGAFIVLSPTAPSGIGCFSGSLDDPGFTSASVDLSKKTVYVSTARSRGNKDTQTVPLQIAPDRRSASFEAVQQSLVGIVLRCADPSSTDRAVNDSEASADGLANAVLLEPDISGLPACAANTMTFTGPGSRIAAGRSAEFRLRADDEDFVGRGGLTMAKPGQAQPFFTDRFSIDQSFGTGRSYRFSLKAGEQATITSSGVFVPVRGTYCVAQVSQQVAAYAGSPAKFGFGVVDDTAVLTVDNQPRDCNQVTTRPARVRITGPGVRSTFVLKDACVGWTSRSRIVDGLRVRLYGAGSEGLPFARINSRRTRDFKGTYRVSVSVAGRAVKTRNLRVVVDFEPGARVYSDTADGGLNDEYFNYCVNEGKNVYSEGGRVYCAYPSVLSRTLVWKR